MIDFHCHLDLYPNPMHLLEETARRNEFTLVVTTSPRAYLGTSQRFAGIQNIHVGLGLHPEVAEAKQNEIDRLVELVSEVRFVGEIGLDGSSRFKHSMQIQERIFRSVVSECERRGGRIMSIHSRGAESRVLDILEAHPSAGVPVLHWFSGNHRELLRAVKHGCWFSVGPAMLAGEKGRTLFREMPMDRILPETDGPFAQNRGKAFMPWEASDIALHHELLNIQSVEEVHVLFRQNLTRLLKVLPNKTRQG